MAQDPKKWGSESGHQYPNFNLNSSIYLPKTYYSIPLTTMTIILKIFHTTTTKVNQSLHECLT